MTEVKTALANSKLVDFLCLELNYVLDIINIQKDSAGVFTEGL
jgi:hypothetical protein